MGCLIGFNKPYVPVLYVPFFSVSTLFRHWQFVLVVCFCLWVERMRGRISEESPSSTAAVERELKTLMHDVPVDQARQHSVKAR